MVSTVTSRLPLQQRREKMSGWTSERWAAASGALFAVLLFVTGAITGDPPDYNASGAAIGDYLTDKHAEVTLQSLCGGALLVLFLWFLSSFAGHFREAGERGLATVIYGAGVVSAAVAAVGDAIAIAAAQLRPVLDEAALQALWGLSFFVYLRLDWAAAALGVVAAIATLRTRALPAWYAWVTLVAVVAFLVGGVSIRMEGFFSPNGGGLLIGLFSFPIWILFTSVVLTARVGRSASSATPVPA